MRKNNPFEGTTTLNVVRDWAEFARPDYLKADNSGNWSLNGAPADPGPYLPLNYRHVLQRWEEERHATIIDEDPLPEADELNRKIPVEEWLLYNNKPRPPWEHALQFALINLGSGMQVIFSANSVRAAGSSVRPLPQRIRWWGLRARLCRWARYTLGFGAGARSRAVPDRARQEGCVPHRLARGSKVLPLRFSVWGAGQTRRHHHPRHRSQRHGG
jgi:hypothetical protein